jgi:ComEC/Rec2-related protein
MRLIGLCAAALAGLAVGDLVPLDAARLVVTALLGLLGALLARRAPAWRLLALAACAAALGAARASSAAAEGPGPPGSIASLATSLGGPRAAIESGVRGYLPEPQASLGLGVLLGGAGGLDAATRLDLQRSGLAHLVAIDGLKQVLVAATLGGLSARLLGPRLGAAPTLAGIVGYTLLTGSHPSAVRAGLMVGLATLASLGGRLADPLTSVLLAAVAMASLQPRVLLDVGLQLSVSATLGIILLWPRLRRRLARLPRWVAEPVGLTLAVTLATLPVMLSTFQVVSLVSPLAHIVALPLLSAVLVSTALLAAASPLAPLAVIVAWAAWAPTTLLVLVIRFFGAWPAASVSTGRLAPPAALCLAAALLGWGIWGLPELAAARLALGRRRARLGRRGAPAACLGVLLAVRAALALVRPDGQLHVERLALARGEAVFIRGPTGRAVLVVAGRADAPSLVQQLGARLAVWEHKLDAAVQVGAEPERALALALERYPADERIVVTRADGHRRVDLGGGVALELSGADGRAAISHSPPSGWVATSTLTTSGARPGSAG